MIERIGVVVPARDEVERVAECLESILYASDETHITVDVFLVADGCVDATAAVARGFAGVTVLELDARSVGSARAAGARAAITAGADWLAFTDADSTVPPHWIAVHLRLAELGWDAVVGTVRPNSREITHEQLRRWRGTHAGGKAIGHVHGANLGVRTGPYLAAGGFRDLPEHEDTELVQRLQPWRIVATASCEVVTSARAIGRTPGGYAGYLRELGLAAG